MARPKIKQLWRVLTVGERILLVIITVVYLLGMVAIVRLMLQVAFITIAINSGLMAIFIWSMLRPKGTGLS